MTRTNDIIAMARQAGLNVGPAGMGQTVWGDITNLERFAAAEREACAKLIESRKTGANELMDAVRDMEAKAIRARGK
jgi:hypothetical protein